MNCMSSAIIYTLKTSMHGYFAFIFYVYMIFISTYAHIDVYLKHRSRD